MSWNSEDMNASGLDSGKAAPLLESLLLNASDSVTITSAEQSSEGDWPIVYVNPAFEEMTGYSREEAVGKTPRILQGPKTDREVLDRIGRDLSEGRNFHGQTVNYRKDGSEFTIEWKIIPVRDGSGEITQYLSIQRDISGEE